MNLSVGLQVRQSQSLVMTPQLLQSIRLLQFHHVELQAFLEREAEANPLIELAAPGLEPPLAAPFGEGAPDLGPSSEAPLPGPGDAPFEGVSGEAGDAQAFADAGGDGALPHPDDGEAFLAAPRELGRGGSSGGEGGFDDRLESLSEAPASRSRHALGEIADIVGNERERRIAEWIFADLDEAGYCPADWAERAERLAVPRIAAETLLERLQGAAEPAGLFARDLAECLAIQLRRRDRFDPVIAMVLANLPLLARRDFAALARLTGEDEAGLLDILREIRTLDPRPGAGLGAEAGLGRAEAMLPDVVVRPVGKGAGWQVDLNADAFPRLLVDQRYVQTVLAGEPSADERAFVSRCQQNATWLARSLDQRARTILKVATEIVRRQDGFFNEGVPGLRPMTLMDVAEAVGLHESTVSRVTANKFMATPRGTVEMKFFFTVAIAASDGGDAHSAESVKLRIARLIGAERPGAVLSDDDIAAALKGEGVDLARRTVAKYREALGLPSSVQRRREMNARRLAG
ncbi:MAG: RNA polymerase factor sigma-54 [Methylobacterium sp.]